MGFKFEKMSVLVVEDNEPMRRLIVSVLETLGVGRILQASDGEKGLSVYQTNKPDAILLDWEMMPMNGIEMIRRIRYTPNMPNRYVPIILITGYGALSRVTQARDAGVTEFLVKPFTAGDLARRLAYIINKPRDFIDAQDYFGPDRRRKAADDYKGPKRRQNDTDQDQEAENWYIGR